MDLSKLEIVTQEVEEKEKLDLEAEVHAAIHKKEVHALANRSIEDIMKMLVMKGVGDE